MSVGLLIMRHWGRESLSATPSKPHFLFVIWLTVNILIGTYVNISTKAQKLLLKVATQRQISVEELASEILNEAIQNKFSEIAITGEVKKEYSSNPLANKQPYAYYA